MNERIRLLAEQAGEEIIAEYEDESRRNRRLYNEIFLPKFAELVILECASQIRFTDLLKCNDDSDGEILLQASVQFKRHFGVEQ